MNHHEEGQERERRPRFQRLRSKKIQCRYQPGLSFLLEAMHQVQVARRAVDEAMHDLDSVFRHYPNLISAWERFIGEGGITANDFDSWLAGLGEAKATMIRYNENESGRHHFRLIVDRGSQR